LNSYLLWIAKTRKLAAANLWVPVPFYLAGHDDYFAHKQALEFFNKRLTLGLDYSTLDTSIKQQNDKLARLRQSSAEIDACLKKLENNQGWRKKSTETW